MVSRRILPVCVTLIVRDGSALALTIGASGSFKQSIVKDRNNLRILDMANAKLVNIQLVNYADSNPSLAWQLQTLPSFRAYAEAGLPFFGIFKRESELDLWRIFAGQDHNTD